MIRLGDIMSLSDLTVAINDGFVRTQVHPDLPLTILNYTEKAQWERAWNNVTRQCRGLIYNSASSTVVARPFEKFFNASELGPSKLGQALSGVVQVTDKMDGSLGIMYPTGSGAWAIATRGSFTSEQAQHATLLLNTKYSAFLRGSISDNWTYLFEIVYPQNRIVLDYGQRDELVLLGARSISHGTILGPDELTEWVGPRTSVFPVHSFKDAKVLPDRPNAEGIVVRNVKTGFMVKIKQEDYVALHRIVTGMNARVVWERMGAGESVDDICNGLPEEFWPWVNDVGGELIHAAWWLTNETYDAFDQIVSRLPEGYTRKDFAMLAQQSEHRSRLFLLLEGRTADVHKQVWSTLKPSGTRVLAARGEDVA